VLGEAAHFGFDLHGELAGGDDDEGLEGMGEVELLEDGQAEGGGLAGAGAGLSEDIDAGEGDGDHFFLDFGRGGEVDLREGVEEGGFKAELFEGGREFDFEVMLVMFRGGGGLFGQVVLLGPGVLGFVFVAEGLSGLGRTTAAAIASTAAATWRSAVLRFALRRMSAWV
jgi:hypothetical protein